MGSSAAAPKVRFRTTEGAALTTAEVVARGRSLPVLLAFFKTSCPICQLTWPYLERLHRAYGEKAVHVVGVSQNDAASSRAYYTEHGGATFDLLLDPEPAFAASNAFDVESVPHLVLLSPQGLVEDVFSGWSRARMEALGGRFAATNIPFTPVVPPGDPVRDSAPG
ncbi:MAG: peroxiredoxin family protein [Thermoanaerobaculia bacterium]